MFLEWACPDSNRGSPVSQTGVITIVHSLIGILDYKPLKKEPREGFEPPALGLQNRCSARLSYRGIINNVEI